MKIRRWLFGNGPILTPYQKVFWATLIATILVLSVVFHFVGNSPKGAKPQYNKITSGQPEQP